ncbi:MAG TPA: hypothetical protein VN908_04610 [Gemmatimonadales bacterium]|nr:hypothetical protein [Gemmatimonadales bacterium]
MRLVLRAGIVLGLAAAACKDSAAPVDFSNPTAITANLRAVDSTFASDAFRSFSASGSSLTPAASAGLQPSAKLLEATRPALGGARPYVLSALRAQRLHQLIPEMSAATAQGRLIPDSLYGRVFEWDAALHRYRWQSTTVAGLTGVRFILYQVDANGAVIEPVVPVGYSDMIDESTPSTLKLHVLVKGTGGAPTYLDYLVTATPMPGSLTATASGFISNGLSAGANKTLTFDETFSANATRVAVTAELNLNNPATTFTLNESVTASDPSIVVSADFRLIRPGEQTISISGRVTLTYNSTTLKYDVTVDVTVRVGSGTVATLKGDPATAQWVDAGGQPLTAADLEALAHLLGAFEHFQDAVESMFHPVETMLPPR